MCPSYLIKVVNTYRTATVEEALKLQDKLSRLETGTLMNFSYKTKYIKEKGEVVEEYQLCQATIEFNKEKEPDLSVSATYGIGLE